MACFPEFAVSLEEILEKKVYHYGQVDGQSKTKRSVKYEGIDLGIENCLSPTHIRAVSKTINKLSKNRHRISPVHSQNPWSIDYINHDMGQP